MSKKTPIYQFLYLEAGDVIYPQYDQDNMTTAENEIFGMYDYFGQGIISGWKIHWMGCKPDPYVLQQRQALIDAYNSNPFSYLALEYEIIGKPGHQPNAEDYWAQCIVVEPGLGILDVYHVATEYPSFFRFTTVNHFYIWAEKNACTPTEYLCGIIAPQYPDSDYDLYNQVVYLGEVFTKNINNKITITQISYSERRREINAGASSYQAFLKQALINHVHSGVGDQPSKITLDTKVTINVLYDANNPNATVFNFILPTGFNPSNYSNPQVYLNGSLLTQSQYNISGTQISLQNSIFSSSVLQIIYYYSPGSKVFITSTLFYNTSSPTLSYNTLYYLTDGTTKTDVNGQTIYNIFTNFPDYERIDLYLGTQILDARSYQLNQDPISKAYNGTLTFLGPIFPSITDYNESDVYIIFVTPSIQIQGLLPESKIKSINASAFTSGKISNYRLAGLDHLGLFKVKEQAKFIPYKKLLDSGDHVHFYPEISSVVQHSDFIIFAYQSESGRFRLNVNESSPPPRTIFSTPNGLFVTSSGPEDFQNILQATWNTDNGLADSFGQNFFGNMGVYPLPTSGSSLNPKYFWILCKSKNQFKNVLNLSNDQGLSFQKINLPLNSSNFIIDINDFISTVDVFQYTTPVSGALGAAVLNVNYDANYIYYVAASDGLYSAKFARTANPRLVIWSGPNKNTSDSYTGSIYKLTEAVNVAKNITVTTTAAGSFTETKYQNYRALYAATDNGLFVYDNGGSGKLFKTNDANYNPTANFSPNIFTYVKWMGEYSGSSNAPQALVWADQSAVYYSNDADFTSVTLTTSTGSTTNQTFVQPLLESSSYTTSVDCASTINVNINQQITANTKIDGFTLLPTSLILLKNQTDPTQNGIYFVTNANFLQINTAFLSPQYVFVKYGETQANTEWSEFTQNNDLRQGRNFGLRYAKIITFPVNTKEKVVSIIKDNSSGPGTSNLTNPGYKDSFFVATNNFIYRILNLSQNIVPTVIRIAWDSSIYGKITNLQHYASSDLDNGTLVVLTENGVYYNVQGSLNVFNVSGTANVDSYSYARFIKTFNSQQALNASVYDEYTYTEYNGQLYNPTLLTTTTSAPDGIYKNLILQTPEIYTTPATFDITVVSGAVTAVLSNTGSGYLYDLPSQGFSPYCNIIANGQVYKIFFSSILTKGIFSVDSDKQLFTFSKATGVNPSRLIYETDYTVYYVDPWVETSTSVPIVIVYIDNISVGDLADQGLPYPTYTYNSSIGEIVFSSTSSNPAILKSQKDKITVTIVNLGQYISNAGKTPHAEINNVLGVGDQIGTLSQQFPKASGDNTLYNLFNKNYSLSSLPSGVFTLQVSGTLTTGVQFKENLQVSVDLTNSKIIVLIRPNSVVLPVNSAVFLTKNINLLGIEDYLSWAKSKLTYNLNSVVHSNVYQLYNALSNYNSQFGVLPTLPTDKFSGTIDRGLKNTFSLKTLSDFDPKVTFVGYTFGVNPSVNDVAAAPTTINLILSFSYGGDATFATDKGIWKYVRSQNKWIKVDSLNNSNSIYFVNPPYSGTNLGFFELQANGLYSLNGLFPEATLSFKNGQWGDDSTKTFKAYGKTDGLIFDLFTKSSKGVTTLQSDFGVGPYEFVYSIYYGIFKRFDSNNNITRHPAIYIGTDKSLYAYTTDAATGVPAPKTPHTILYGREMFSDDTRIYNPSKLDPTQNGLPAKIFQVTDTQVGNNIWMVIATSSGVYVSNMWSSCDVGNPNGLPITMFNKNWNPALNGVECYKVVQKSGSKTTYFVATSSGVFISYNNCQLWQTCSNFAGKTLAVTDLFSFVNSGVNYLIAATSLGLWITDDDGSSWYTLKSYPDANISINVNPVNGIPLNQNPKQSFSSLASGYVSKAFLYLNSSNLIDNSVLYATISNGSITTQSSTLNVLSSNSIPGMYQFGFTSAFINSNTTYYLGLSTGDGNYANGISSVVWGLSNLQNPYLYGNAYVSNSVIPNQDFFFQINLNTGQNPIEIIEPVGFYNTSSPIGFASGKYIGASISSNGYLYSNVGIICNLIIDISKSIEINDSGIITLAGESSSYVATAMTNSLVGSQSLYTRLTNGFGTSKMLISAYGFNNAVIDLLQSSTDNTGSVFGCLSQTSTLSVNDYTNSPSLITTAISYVSNTGRLSKLYDTVLFNTRLQFPAIVSDYYRVNLDQVDLNFVNLQVVSSQYKSDVNNYVTLNLNSIGSNSYSINYSSDTNNFVFSIGSYSYGKILNIDGSAYLFDVNSFISSHYLNNSTGIFTTSLNTPSQMILSYNWAFSQSTLDLALDTSLIQTNNIIKELVLANYSQSFKPLILVSTDGNDNSLIQSSDVNSSAKVAWTGSGTQLLVVSPDNCGNENFLRDMIQNTNSAILKYDTYPEQLIKNVLVINDNLNLFTSNWQRKYDFPDPIFISYILASYVTPSSSTVEISFVWSSDRVNFSNKIILSNNSKFYLNQKVTSIYYNIDLTESYDGTQRYLPYVTQLYHVQVVPSTQVYFTEAKSVTGQLHQTLALSSFNNNSLVDIMPVVTRSQTTDPTYYEFVQLNRHGVLADRQSSFKITLPYTVQSLSLFPAVKVNGVYDYLSFYIVDSYENIKTWTSNDTLNLTYNGTPIDLKSLKAVIPENGIIVFYNPQVDVNGSPSYSIYSASISYGETRKSIIGEPTTTYDYKTYFLKNGSIPPDASVVVLVNQEIYRGDYQIDYYTGAIIFAKTRDQGDYVSVFIKFSDYFRAGLEIQSYSNQNVVLQSYNFTYTAIPDGKTYTESFNVSLPYLVGNPQITPLLPNLNDLMSVTYQYVDNQNISEKQSNIYWWRKRTGIEYVIYNSSQTINVTGNLVGLSTINVQSVTSTNAFVISVTLNGNGGTANVVDTLIMDRGANFVGFSTAINDTYQYKSGTSISNLSMAIFPVAYNLNYDSNYVTNDGFCRITPNNPNGYLLSKRGYISTPTFTSFPTYDSRLSERNQDTINNYLFDYRDQVYITVQPNNGFALGVTVQSNIVTLGYYYTPTASNLLFSNFFSDTQSGINTVYTITSGSDQTGTYNYYTPDTTMVSGLRNTNNLNFYDSINWYKTLNTGSALLTSGGTLSSNLYAKGDQIFFSVTPGYLKQDGTVGYGATALSDIYLAN